jgi:hypothetical protein
MTKWTEYQGLRFLSDAPEGFTHDELLQTWIRLHKLPGDSPESVAHFWAFEVVDELVRGNPAYAWSLILDILAADPSRQIMETLSAGPLENLLARHGPAYIDAIEKQARADPLFARLLGGVWQNAMTADVWQRVQRARD